MSNDTTNTNALTAEQVATVLVEPLRAASRFLAAGPTVFDTAGPLRVPVNPTYDLTSTSWTGEGQVIPEVTAGKREVKLLPSTMNSIKVISRYTSELARQAVVPIESTLRASLVQAVSAKLDAQLFSATGDGIETPEGMFKWSGVQTHAVTGPLNLDHILAAQGLALAANVDASALRLFIRPDQFTALRGLTDGNNRYLLEPDATAGVVGSILGLGVVVSAAIPNGMAAVADMRQVAVARDVDASVTVLDQAYASTDEIGIRVVTRYDARPLNPEAIVTLTGITAG